MQDDNQQQQPQPDEEFDITSLADSLLGKEEKKPDDENKGAEQAKPDAEAEKDDKKPEEGEKDEKPADGDKPADNSAAGDKPAEGNKEEGKPAEEDLKPLTREDIRAALREEAEARAATSEQRTSFAGKVRADLKEALKLDSTYTTVALDDGTPITSVSQLTQVINPETDEPYTREEAAQLLLEAQQIVQDNMADYEKRVDQLTDLNVDFKEQADEVDRLYGHVLKAFPEQAKAWLENYQKTFTTSEDGQYVTNVPISPLDFYRPIVQPFLNAAQQAAQQQVEAKAAEERAAQEAAVKAEQEDRGDLGGTAGAAQGKPDLLGDALDKYLSDI